MSNTYPYNDALVHHARNRGDKLAIWNLSSDTRLTYADLDERANRLASWLQSIGVERGDRVALLALNGSEFFELQYAVSRIGAIAVLLNLRLTASELEYIVNDSGAKILIHDATFAEMASELHRRCNLSELLEINLGKPDSAYEKALASSNKAPKTVALTHDDPCIIMYTSGTTGHPKGAIITQGMLFWNTVNVTYPCKISTDVVHFILLPFFHIGGLNSHANPTLHAGGTLIVRSAFDAGETLRIVGDPEYAVTHITGVTAQYLFISQHPDFEKADLSAIRFAGLGGSPTPASLIETYAKRGVPMSEGFGMTEASPGVASLGAEHLKWKLGSIGKPLQHTQVRIVGEDGKDVERGQVGEMWIRGPNVTPGYWNNPEATNRAFVDGWFRTGDASREDEDGFFYIVDRVKDMYISGGENVYPAEIENVIYRLPQIAEVAVIGAPDEKWGESGLAYIALKQGQSLSQEDVIGHCREHLAKFKIPSRVVFTGPLPRNASGKVLKHTLREDTVTAE